MGAVADTGLLVITNKAMYTLSMPKLKCKICSSEFNRSEYRLSRTSGQFCSIACSNRGRTIRVQKGDKRFCTTCKKLSDNFRPKSLTKCRDCENKSRREWYANNREQALAMVRRNHIKRKYGVTAEQYDDMKKLGCGICGQKDSLVLDHDHISGKTRSMLCQNCNKGLGHFKDNPNLLKEAINYLGQGWW